MISHLESDVIIKSTPSLLFRELLKLQQVSLKNQNRLTIGDLVGSEPGILRNGLLRIVDDVRTILQKQNGYIYIPDLKSYPS